MKKKTRQNDNKNKNKNKKFSRVVFLPLAFLLNRMPVQFVT